MQDETIILGIDLGTTYSAMAYVDRYGKPNILPNADGHATTPSALYFYDQGECVVGQEAVKMSVVDPANVVQFIKRAMGDTDYVLEFHEQPYTPQELSAFVLRKLKEDAEEALGLDVTQAVITVPAYFNAAQRAATAQAARIAGLQALSILNEPTAAAIALAMEKLGGQHRMMVFDLGGGTFDVTVMEIDGTELRTIASDGNAELGGKDWDDRLVNHVAERFMELYDGLDPRDDPRPYQELYERCLMAKIALSSKPRAAIPVTYKGKRAAIKVTREDFQGLCQDLVDQCETTCNIVLEKAGIGWGDLDEVLLVGGSTRMPMIRHLLASRSGWAHFRDINPDECVALGAALAAVFRHQTEHPALRVYRDEVLARAGKTSGDGPILDLGDDVSAPPDTPTPIKQVDEDDDPWGHGEFSAYGHGLPKVDIQDVCTHPLGVVVLDRQHNERVVNLIREHTPLPCEKRSRFAYAYDNMTAVRVQVTEGAGLVPEEVTVIGDLVLSKLPPRPRGTPIEVVYRYTADSILEVDVIDVETKAVRRGSIRLRGGLDERELQVAEERMQRARLH